MRTAARFPTASAGRGHYESFYLKAGAPEGGRAIWIRLTFHRRPGRPATAAIWLTCFDRERDRPLALKAQVGEDQVSAPDGSYVRVAGSEIGPNFARGELEVGGRRASWDLRFADGAPPLRHLRPWMYRTRLPRTKLLSPHPAALVEGELEIDGERIAIERWPGMLGHNWGSEHAATWVWIQAAVGGAADYLDIGAGRIRVGGRLTPWLANGGLHHGGTSYRLGGLRVFRPALIEAGPTSCRFRISGDGVTVDGTVSAPAERFVGWVYSDPGGGEHDSLNCSISDLEVVIERDERRERIALDGSATYEFGTTDRGHGIPIEPHPDG